jgi:hypothetical protein
MCKHPQGHVKDISDDIEVWSPAPEEQVRALLEPGKRKAVTSA